MTETKPTTTKGEVKELLRMIWKYRSTAAKLAVIPVFFVVAEFAQILAAVAMLSLLLPMPAGVLGTSAGAFGGWNLFRYATKEIPQQLRGKGKRPTSGARTLIDSAQRSAAASNTPRPRPTPEQLAMLSQLVGGMRKAAPGKPDDGDGNIGQYL